MTVEDDAEHVVDLALLVVCGRPLGRDAREVRRVDRHAGTDRDAVHLVHVEQLVVDAEARLFGEVVDAVDRREEGIALALQEPQRGRHRRGCDDQRRLLAEEDGVEH